MAPQNRTSTSLTPSTTTSFPSTPLTPSVLTPSTFTDSLPLPKLLVFDLDYTLWPFWVDTHVSPPLRASKKKQPEGSSVTDASGMECSFYPEVPAVLAACERCGIKVAAASRTHAPELAGRMLDLLRVTPVPLPTTSSDDDSSPNPMQGIPQSRPSKSFFTNLQIYPGDKSRHMTRLKEKLGVEFKDMLFFDDESRNRNVERELGVVFVLVRDGVSVEVVDDGVRSWRKRWGHKV